MTFPVTENTAKTPHHTSFYLACGAEDAPLIVFVHGWPELSISWRHQLRCLGALGFRAVAPDMRGYGRSSFYSRHEDYAVKHLVKDMLDFLDKLGVEKAIWAGHDWGTSVVWNLASHHPDRCIGVANLCVPYIAEGFTLKNIVPLVDREVYPEKQYPYGQWEYMAFYEENFAKAVSDFEADIAKVVKITFRAGSPEGRGQPCFTAFIRKQGGWFPTGIPDLPMDTSVLTEEDFHSYTAAFERNGFYGPCSWYVNHERNGDYAKQAVNGGKLKMPVLFLHGAYDYICETMDSELAEPMRQNCERLSEVVVKSGHFIAQEKPAWVNAAIARWLAIEFPNLWRI